MLAVGLTLGLFLFWLAVGYAVVHRLNAEKDPLANLLLAPAVGVAVIALPLLVLSRLGAPVRHSGLPVTLVVAVGAGLIYWLRRPPVPPKSYLPFALVLLLALPAVGRPMFQFGFDWMSYCNDDMANYCLSARRLYDHGVFDRPTERAMLSGTDYSQVYWFMHVPLMSRIGVELLMGWTRSVTRLNEHALFMPLILAFHLVLVSAAGAMALQEPKEKESRRIALVVCALLVFSAMTTLGTLFQLIAQVIGLAMLAAAATVVLRSFSTLSRGDLLRHGVLVGILCTGLVAIYPEVSPFLALAFAAFLAVHIVRMRRLPKLTLMTLVVGAGVSAVVLNVNLPWVLAYILNQGAGGTIPDDPANAELPYFLVPRGLANLWGFQSITDLVPEPFMSITIGLGAILLLGSIALAVRMAWRENRAALFLVIMFGLGALLYRQRTGFGLFKLSMFMQPFLLTTVVCGWFAWFKRPIVRYALPAALLVGGLVSQQSYVSDSRGVGAKFTLIPSATPSHLVREIEHVAADNAGRPMIADFYNVALAKFQALHAQGTPLKFPSDIFFRPIMAHDQDRSLASKADLKLAMDLTIATGDAFTYQKFDLHDSTNPNARNRFIADSVAGGTEPADGLLIRSTGVQGVFNRRSVIPKPPEERNFVITPLKEARNHLIFISSELGRAFYAGRWSVSSVYQLEDEPAFFPHSTMAGVGRHMLFEVVNPSPKVRFAIELTSSYLNDGQNLLPPAVAIGKDRQPFPFIGRGGGRVVSPAIEPQEINGRYYVALDLGAPGKQFSYPRRGLMALYGRDVAIDRRVVVSFARDISLIADGGYDTIQSPAGVEHFPQDLANRDFEYAGLYEDGWVSESAFFRLTPPAVESDLVVSGTLPTLSDATFTNELMVLLDDREVARKSIGVGPFDVRVPVKDSVIGTRRVDLRFSRSQHLHNDKRAAAALLQKIGFEPTPLPITKLPTELATPQVEGSAGVFEDGWAAKTAAFQLKAPAGAAALVVRGMTPRIDDPNFSTELVVAIDGREAMRKMITPGDFELRAPIASGAASHRVELRFSRTQRLPGEQRDAAALLHAVRFE